MPKPEKKRNLCIYCLHNFNWWSIIHGLHHGTTQYGYKKRGTISSCLRTVTRNCICELTHNSRLVSEQAGSCGQLLPVPLAVQEASVHSFQPVQTMPSLERNGKHKLKPKQRVNILPLQCRTSAYTTW